MTLEQFQQVNARLREYFDPVELPEWWGSRQPLLDGRFAIDCSYHEVMRLIDLSRFTPGLSLLSTTRAAAQRAADSHRKNLAMLRRH